VPSTGKPNLQGCFLINRPDKAAPIRAVLGQDNVAFSDRVAQLSKHAGCKLYGIYADPAGGLLPAGNARRTPHTAFANTRVDDPCKGAWRGFRSLNVTWRHSIVYELSDRVDNLAVIVVFVALSCRRVGPSKQCVALVQIQASIFSAFPVTPKIDVMQLVDVLFLNYQACLSHASLQVRSAIFCPIDFTASKVHVMTNNWFVTWSPADWSAFGTVLAAIANVVLAIGASFAALRAVYLYKESKRNEAAHWLQGMFEQFYLSDEFLTGRSLLQYEYKDSVAPLLERRLTDRDVPQTSRQAEILHELDRLLNYFEWILYLEQNEHLAKDDRLALFRYWFDLMKHSDKGALRRYCATWDWELLSHELASADGAVSDEKPPKYQTAEYVAVYGSLMSDLPPEDAPDFAGYFDPSGPCTIEGCLYDLGSYPGLVAGEGTVKGELYRLKFPLSDPRSVQAFRALDKFERFSAHKVRESLYVRQVVRLKEPAGLDVWVYIYNRQTQDLPLVPNGDWREHIRHRNPAPLNEAAPFWNQH
jgi:gamma-glutamylcyclotransferase (GGCT)/AIG2-like uncharacterized protein YtfP